MMRNKTLILILLIAAFCWSYIPAIECSPTYFAEQDTIREYNDNARIDVLIDIPEYKDTHVESLEKIILSSIKDKLKATRAIINPDTWGLYESSMKLLNAMQFNGNDTIYTIIHLPAECKACFEVYAFSSVDSLAFNSLGESLINNKSKNRKLKSYGKHSPLLTWDDGASYVETYKEGKWTLGASEQIAIRLILENFKIRRLDAFATYNS